MAVISKQNSNKNIVLQVKDFSKGFDISKGENITSMDTAIDCYNFDFNSGALTEGIGFKNFTTPTSKNSDENQTEIHYDDFENLKIKSLWHYKHYSTTRQEYLDKLMFYASDGYVWYVALNTIYPTTTKLLPLDFSKQPKMFNTKIASMDSVIMSNGVDNLGFWNGDGTPIRYEDCPKIISLCDYKNKLYYITGGEQTYLKYSTNYHLTQWTETPSTEYDEGSFEVNDGLGRINKLLTFQGKMYAIRDYNIMKITIYDSMSSPTYSNEYTSGTRIYANTLQICGDMMFMLTRGGLIKFDGVTAKKMDLKFEKMLANIDNKNAVSCFHDGKYALACKLDFNDNKKIGCENEENYINNSLILIDIETGDYTITRGVDIADLTALQSESLNKIIFCFNTVNSSTAGEMSSTGKFFSQSAHKFWSSPLSDLGYSNKRKLIKDISLISKYDCTLTIFTEKESKSFKVFGSELLNKFPVRLRGKQLGFKIETDSDKAYISNLMMNIELLDSGNTA